MNRAVLFFTLLLCVFHSAIEAGETTRILFIGNSYTGQIRKAVTEMIESSPEGGTTELEFITPGGKTLGFHLNNEATVQRIADGKWDYVVLQDQSQTPALFPRRFRDAARGLDKLIDDAGAKTVFYETWGRRDGDKANRERFPDYESMQKSLSDSYQSTAARCGALLAPVGEVWARVRKADDELGVSLYKKDGSHPSAKGAYLAACVFYKTIFEKSPNGNRFDRDLTKEELAVILRAVDAG